MRMCVCPIFELTDVYLSTQLVFDLQLSNLVAELSYHCTYIKFTITYSCSKLKILCVYEILCANPVTHIIVIIV